MGLLDNIAGSNGQITQGGLAEGLSSLRSKLGF